MNKFWEQSPLWQRAQEVKSEFYAAEKAMEEAGKSVLMLIQIDADAPRGQEWRDRRQAYRDATEKYLAVFKAWCAADKAFEASAVGQAYTRYLGDPLAFRAPEAAESEAA